MDGFSDLFTGYLVQLFIILQESVIRTYAVRVMVRKMNEGKETEQEDSVFVESALSDCMLSILSDLWLLCRNFTVQLRKPKF